MKFKLPSVAYLRIAQAAKELGCEVEHIIHWAAEGKTRLYLMLDNTDCLMIFRKSMVFSSQLHMSDDDHDRLSGSVFKVINGDMGLSKLSLCDVRPNANGDIPKIFHRFTYGGRTFPMALLAQASNLWAVGPGLAKHMEIYGEVSMRSFFTENGYVLNPDIDVDDLQVCIVPITAPKDFNIPDKTINPQHLWLSNESLSNLINSDKAQGVDINEGVAQGKPRHSPKKHAMLCLLVELLGTHDTAFMSFGEHSQRLNAGTYAELTNRLAELLQTHEQSAEQLIQILFVRCAQSGIAFDRFKHKSIHEWEFTPLTDEVVELLNDRPHKDAIFSRLSALDKNTMKCWIKKQQP